MCEQEHSPSKGASAPQFYSSRHIHRHLGAHFDTSSSTAQPSRSDPSLNGDREPIQPASLHGKNERSNRLAPQLFDEGSHKYGKGVKSSHFEPQT